MTDNQNIVIAKEDSNHSIISINKRNDEKPKKTSSPNNLAEENDNSSTVNTNTKQIEWSPENEMIMVEWCDVAQCYKWLNTKAYAKFSKQHAWFTIPAITLSTISGTASFAQTSLPLEYQPFAPMVIGTVNIFIGILTTIQQYLKISELNESHRVAAIAWDKYARNIRIELAKAPCERMDAGHFLKLSRQEFDRLMETSPQIPTDIIGAFKSTFSKKEGYEELRKPDICDIILSSNQSRHHWYLDEANIASKSIDSTENNTFMLNKKIVELQRADLANKKREMENKIKQEADEKANKRRGLQDNFAKMASELTNKIKTQNKHIDDYVTKFYHTVGRRPLPEEIITHFESDVSIHIDTDIMTNYMKKYSTEDAVHSLV